jgi:hypothetical protein
VLVLSCAQATIAWTFGYSDPTHRQALCVNDAFKIVYDTSPSTGRPALLQALLAHTVQLGGAIGHVVYVPL